MCDDWDDHPAERPPQNSGYDTQVYRNSNQGSSNWRDNRGDNSNYNPQRQYHNNGPRDGRGGYGGGGRGGGGGGGGFRRQNQDGDATEIRVPSKFVGRIIGRGGSKIHDLQYESGARINVTKEIEGDQTVIKLFGDSGAVEKAESLIRNLTVERDAPMYTS